MEIGKPQHVYRVEPLVNPVPQKASPPPLRPSAPPERAEPLKAEPLKAK
jgi:hypothetical protein